MQKLWILLLVIGLTGCGATASRQASEPTPESLIVYFNDPLTGFPEMNELPAPANSLYQTFIELLDSAHASLDIAIYHLTAPDVLEALHRACSRSVKIRMVLEATEASRQEIPSCIQLKLDLNERLMHHKFVIVDQHTVWTGSTNWTQTGFYFDTNNAVVIQSQPVARAYQAEFTEMFSQNRYGKAKRDTNEERFQVNDLPLEVYFSPSDRPRQRMLELIRGAQETIRLALFAFTDAHLYDELLAARGRGVNIEAIWDFLSLAGCYFSKIDELQKVGIGWLEASPGLLHHKYAIIDDLIVITGSANWSVSGMESNDENILVIHDQEIAQRYRESFEQLVQDARTYERDGHQPPRVEVRHFSIVRDAALVQWRPHALGVVERYEVCRLSDSHSQTCERTYEAPGWAWYFVDREVSPGREYFYRVRSRTADHQTDYSNIYRARVLDDIPLLSFEQAQQDVQLYEGKTVTVGFQVANKPEPKGREGHVYLNAGENYKTDFTAFIPACALERFTGSGLDLLGLQDRIVEVTGELEEYNGPEIVVTGPWQIRVLP